MAVSLKASKQGLELVDLARRKKGWSRQDGNWLDAASVSLSVLKRFWRRLPVRHDAFVKICEALGVDWEQVIELGVVGQLAPEAHSGPISWHHEQSITNPKAAQETEIVDGATSAVRTTQEPDSKVDPSFVGREDSIAELDRLADQGSKIVLIHAPGGVGKSTLAYRYLKVHFKQVLELWMAKEPQNITSAESVVEEWLRRYLDDEPGRDFWTSLERLRQKLRESSQPIGVLIDNLEPALDKDGKFIETHRSYLELLRVLADPDVQSVTLITSRERLRESAITPQVYSLTGLDNGAWQKFFEHQNITVDLPVLHTMHKVYAGNAKAMVILTGAVQSDFAGDLAAYWKANREDFLAERDLEDLVVSQLKRLQQLEPDAYKLLCRLGCYRYQDVPTVPVEGLLCMIWDIPEERHRRVIRALQDRSLVNSRSNDFWLHPVIQAEAIKHLRNSEDWKVANIKAAEFWQKYVKSVEDLRDALQALESYFHYINIGDFQAAAFVLTAERNNHWESSEALGRSLIRLGALNTTISLINHVIGYVETEYELSSLLNIAGEINWLLGNLKLAIEQHRSSGMVAQRTNSSDLKEYMVCALLNEGFVAVDLWDIEEAIKLFNQANILIDDLGDVSCERYRADVFACLALLNAIHFNYEDSYAFIQKAIEELNKKTQTIFGAAYSYWCLGLAFKYLREEQKAFEAYAKSYSVSLERHYTQIQAKVLVGISELYRHQQDFENAFYNLFQAVEKLKDLGARCDLAEAYVQLALTYRSLSRTQESEDYVERALRIFVEVQASKQIERV